MAWGTAVPNERSRGPGGAQGALSPASALTGGLSSGAARATLGPGGLGEAGGGRGAASCLPHLGRRAALPRGQSRGCAHRPLEPEHQPPALHTGSPGAGSPRTRVPTADRGRRSPGREGAQQQSQNPRVLAWPRSRREAPGQEDSRGDSRGQGGHQAGQEDSRRAGLLTSQGCLLAGGAGGEEATRSVGQRSWASASRPAPPTLPATVPHRPADVPGPQARHPARQTLRILEVLAPAPETRGGDWWQVFGQWPPEGLPKALQVQTSCWPRALCCVTSGKSLHLSGPSFLICRVVTEPHQGLEEQGPPSLGLATRQAPQWRQLRGSPLPPAEPGALRPRGVGGAPSGLAHSPSSRGPAPTCAGINQPAASGQQAELRGHLPAWARPLASQAEGAICWARGTSHHSALAALGATPGPICLKSLSRPAPHPQDTPLGLTLTPTAQRGCCGVSGTFSPGAVCTQSTWTSCPAGQSTALRAQAPLQPPCLAHEPGPPALPSPPPGHCPASSLGLPLQPQVSPSVEGGGCWRPGWRSWPAAVPAPPKGAVQRVGGSHPPPAGSGHPGPGQHLLPVCSLHISAPHAHPLQHQCGCQRAVTVSRGTASLERPQKVPLPPLLPAREAGGGVEAGPGDTAGSRCALCSQQGTGDPPPGTGAQTGRAGWAQPGAPWTSSGSVSPAAGSRGPAREGGRPGCPARPPESRPGARGCSTNAPRHLLPLLSF
ncbi:uncharacterized protein LOC144370941 [Ictidomys tridecemlineatus]